MGKNNKAGWQPSELYRQGRRASTAAGGRLVGLAMAVDRTLGRCRRNGAVR